VKATLVIVLLLLASLNARAQTPSCMEWESRLKTDIHATNACEAKYQACKGLGPTNPMRELNYCRNLLQRCESLAGPIENEELKRQVEKYQEQCS